MLVPIGGTEQNGAHMALGKHNARVRVLAAAHRRAPRQRARGAGHRLRARRQHRPADRPHALSRHAHDSRHDVRAGARGAARSLRAQASATSCSSATTAATRPSSSGVAAAPQHASGRAAACAVHAVPEYYARFERGLRAVAAQRTATRDAEIGAHGGARGHSLDARHGAGDGAHRSARRPPPPCRASPATRAAPRAALGEARRRRSSWQPPPTPSERARARVRPDHRTFPGLSVTSRPSPFPRSRRWPAASVLSLACAAAIAQRRPRPSPHQPRPRRRRAAPTVTTVPGMPPVVERGQSLQRGRGRQACPAPSTARCRASTCRTSQSNDVYVIDPATFKVVDKFKVGLNPQHVVPSWDLSTLWVANNAEGTQGRQPDADRPEDRQARQGDPRRRSVQHVFHAGRHARRSSWPRRTSASTSAIRRRWRCSRRSTTPGCARHQPRRLLDRRPLRDLHLRVPGQPRRRSTSSQPQGDLGPTRSKLSARRGRACRRTSASSPDGKRFYVADMMADGVFVVDGETFKRDRVHRRPARARTASIRAATARSSTSPIAARTRSTGPPRARAACR